VVSGGVVSGGVVSGGVVSGGVVACGVVACGVVACGVVACGVVSGGASHVAAPAVDVSPVGQDKQTPPVSLFEYWPAAHPQEALPGFENLPAAHCKHSPGISEIVINLKVAVTGWYVLA